MKHTAHGDNCQPCALNVADIVIIVKIVVVIVKIVFMVIIVVGCWPFRITLTGVNVRSNANHFQI